MTRERKMSISDLPREIESEILSKVPANSLGQLKTTCKRWCSLFKDPKFIEKQFASQAGREIILLTNFMVYSIRINTHVIDDGVAPSVEFAGKLKAIKNVKISEIFQCDGLVLCTTEGKTRLLVWNPCNGETRWIERGDVKASYGTYALGYGNDSYKVLMLRCYEKRAENIHVSEFEIYDFSSDSWKVIDGLACKIALLSAGVSLRENAYWMAFDQGTGVFLLSFDFTTERFGRVPLPFQSSDRDDTMVLSAVKDGRLSVLYQSRYASEAKIWVTDKVSEAKEVSWSEFLEVDLCEFMVEDEEMILESFLLDEEKEVAVCCDVDIEDGERTRIFIVGEEDFYVEVYKEPRRRRKSGDFPLLLSYVPSLVRLQKDTAAKGKRKRTTRRLVK